ncbi:Adaptive-response sensory-kinase SasA [Bdellovibrio bacteriovorus]|nr:Adaptive-response sensory-kinase SasA [Bdellovibrio bacteriovorus]
MGSPVLFTNIRKNLHFLMALSVLGIASIVIFGWILRDPALIQIRPDFAPMVINTALGLAALAMALLFSEGRFLRISFFSSLFAFLLGTINLLQYLTGIDLGIDQALVEPFYSVGVASPGRMSISTSVCMLLLGVMGVVSGRSYARRMVRITISSLVLGFSILGFLGYFLNFSSEYGWGAISRMAIHTSLSFVLLSLAHILQLRRSVRDEESGRSAVVPLYVVMIGVLTAVGIWQLLLLKDIERNRSITLIRAESFRSKLDGTFIPLEKALQHMSRRMAVGAYRDESVWRMDAQFYYEEFKGIRRIAWADQNLLLRWLYPMDDFSRNIRNTTMGRSAEIRRSLDMARESHQSRISRVIDMKSGGRGFALLVPVYKNTEFAGILSAGIEIQTFLDRFARIEGYHVAIYEDGQEVYRSSDWDPVLSRDWLTRIHYTNMGVDWAIVFAPSTGAIRSNTSALPSVVLVFAVGISVLLGLSLSFYNRSDEMRKRARAVADWKSAAMDATPLMMISFDEHGIVREMNRSAEEKTGWKAEEIAGKEHPFIFHDPQDVELMRLRLESALKRPVELGVDFFEAMFEAGFNTASEWTYVNRNGSRFLGQLFVGKVFGENGDTTGYLAVVEDVTQKRQREKQIKEQEDKIIASARLASLGEMAAGIAHEINNPLTIINGHVGVLRRLLGARGLATDIEVQKRVEVVENTTQRIAKIVKGLRYYSRDSDPGDMEWVTVDAIIDDTLAFCSDKFRHEGVDLIARLEPNLKVYVRPYQISQVLLNLLNNAADAVQSVNTRKVVVEAKGVKDGVEISISDSGPGVPAFLRDKIMEPFFTTKEVGKGVGLGLSISEGIVRSHEGRFYLDTEASQTRFVVWLPAKH